MNRLNETVLELHASGWSTRRIARHVGTSHVAVFKYLRKHGKATPKQYARGLCEICKEDRPLDADHDHATGKARGLLCRPCNQALGHFEDNPERLRNALTYLETTND